MAKANGTAQALARPLGKKPLGQRIRRDLRMNYGVYLVFLPVLVYYILFHYLPMFGIVMAFQDFKPARGFLASEWVGFRYFIEFMTNDVFFRVLRNTLVINILGLVFGTVTSIGFALLLNEIKYSFFKRPVQTISYMPFFVSAVVIAGLVIEFVSSNGIITNLLVGLFGIKRENLLTNPAYFWWINLFSDLWQGIGYGSIIYIAALGDVSPELHEAAAMDGANRLRRMWHITLPAIKPTIAVMLVMRMGSLLQVGSDKILLIYNPSIYETADVISTHVYRMGLERAQYGYSAAVGLFNSLIGLILIIVANTASRKLADTTII